jgi:predicted solute-binding protein
LRVSVVDFLNARPLVCGLLRNPPAGFEVVRDLPSACAEKLRDGRAYAGLIPSIEFQRIPDLVRIDRLGIAADSEVRSVLLVSNVSREKIRTLKLDPASRTSAVLVRVLLKRRYGVVPRILRPDEVAPSDAELVIGDPAMKTRLQGRVVLDLAAEWKSLTGFPFVFAFWAVRREAWKEDLSEVFERSYRFSRDNFDAMIDSEVEAARPGGEPALSREVIEDYLRHSLHYELGPRDNEGLELFYRLAREEELA